VGPAVNVVTLADSNRASWIVARVGLGSTASATSLEVAVRAVVPTEYCTLPTFRIVVPGGVT
jgi:predicted RNase H-like nuclease